MTNEQQTKPKASEEAIYDPFLCPECAPFGYCWKKCLSNVEMQDEIENNYTEIGKSSQKEMENSISF